MVIKKMINCTPHVINVLDGSGLEIAAIEPSGIVARCSNLSEKVDTFLLNGRTVSVNRKKFGEVNDLPDEELGTIYIVSLIVQNAAVGRNDLLVVDEIIKVGNELKGCSSFAIK